MKKSKKSPPPITKKQLRSFLGLVGWYRKFIPHFATVTACLTDLLRKGKPNKLNWLPQHHDSFIKLKKLIMSPPILRAPDFKRPWVVQTDASDYAIGAALLQEYDGVLLPLAFASRKLQTRETRYSVIEKEGLAMIFGIRKFERYLYGQEFILCTDHAALGYIQRCKPENSRVLRWSLYLQNYKFTDKVIKGTENVLSDYLSRL